MKSVVIILLNKIKYFFAVSNSKDEILRGSDEMRKFSNLCGATLPIVLAQHCAKKTLS